jgi:protein-tyrosine phosphatase
MGHWILNKAVLPIDESYCVIPGKFRAGRYPASISEIKTRKKLNWLLEQGINFIIDLTEEGEAGTIPYLDLLHNEAEKNHCEVTYRRMPIRDFSVPSVGKIIKILNKIDMAIEKGRHIYLHCQGGKGRTGLIVGCYLVRHGTTGNQALRRIQALRREIPGGRSSSPETEGQKRMVMEWKQGH